MTAQGFREFWPCYLGEHARPLTRAMHVAGTGAAVALVAAAAVLGRWEPLALAPLAGYGPAWASHFLVERNRPATFRHPLWSLAADFRMAWWVLSGRMGRGLSALSRARPPE
ncbi:MAG: DUF962 domain-containing protein [Planctomycetes bacterium]|nr:DUF962 domain-containing protein [Planctomycetota bacterium]